MPEVAQVARQFNARAVCKALGIQAMSAEDAAVCNDPAWHAYAKAIEAGDTKEMGLLIPILRTMHGPRVLQRWHRILTEALR